MAFIADRQTLEDLNMLDRYSNGSIFVLFNQVKTKGGEMLLDNLFRNLLTEAQDINDRSNLFKYFQELNIGFPLDAEQFTVMENFLHLVEQPNWFTSFGQTIRRQGLHFIGLHEEYNLFVHGLRTTIILLNQLDAFFTGLLIKCEDNPYEAKIQIFQKFYKNKQFRKLDAVVENVRISPTKLLQCTYLFGNIFYKEMLALLNLLYQLDVFIAVGQVARKNGLNYAKAFPTEGQKLMIKNCRYPTLKNAVGNDVFLNQTTNVLFLTGANMAGKSTLMKSIGVTVYLAHMGFPVAADQMEFSVKDGIYSSINVPDNINKGYSHFYVEVLRVKTVAEEVGKSKNLLVIFDELFKGTNVKDAFDATLAVTDAFAEYNNCSFIISSHILEVATELGKDHANIQFSFFPTIMKGKIPDYPYKLSEGVSDDRHGMIIIQNEGILAMLQG